MKEDQNQDVVDILTTDHHEALQLLEQIKAAAGDQRRDLTDTLIAELVRHSVAEEMFVYPAMKQHLDDGAEAVEHDTKEHEELETLMKQLEGLKADDAAFDETLGQLEDVLRDHVQDEEQDQFPKLRAKIPAEELMKLGVQVEGAKKIAPTRPHPAAPNNKLFHLVAGPGVGMVDRLRDHLTGRAANT
ncbi:MAG: hemerythrin domain-containing protein [Jatrophihabitans sp.]|uniref:hemerythrin domain-containing protein n=1 Tax=Jatrophihabitans sp. TaxID=1932789 RepID=UPI003F7EA13B